MNDLNLNFPEPAGTVEFRHLTSVSALSDSDLHFLLTLSQYYGSQLRAGEYLPQRLKGMTQVNLFLENSTRTNSSFELAGKKLGAHLLVVPVAASSVHKGEELRDTSQTLAAMGIDAMVVRNTRHGTAQLVAKALQEANLNVAVINGGEGTLSHPTQGLLDAVTILDDLGRTPADGLEGITIAICGDIKHSRVARSNANLLPRLGATVRFVGPRHFFPDDDELPEIERFESLKDGLEGCRFVMGLRIQKERIEAGSDITFDDFQDEFGLNHETLRYARDDAKLMHPGPMNRGIELDGRLADDRSKSLILDQVANGVTTRMAVLDAVLTRRA